MDVKQNNYLRHISTVARRLFVAVALKAVMNCTATHAITNYTVSSVEYIHFCRGSIELGYHSVA